MNYKSLTIIALVLMALCVAVPVSAMWNNGNWVSEDKNNGCDNVKFDPKTGVTSCYRDNNPANEIKASENGNGGWAEGSIRAGYSTLSDTIYVRNVLQDKNGTPMVIKVGADAKFRIPMPDDGNLAPGRYSATLDNLDLPDETVEFDISANQQGPTLIGDFKGQAVSAEPATVVAEIQPTNDVTICSAIYAPTLRNIEGHCKIGFRGTCEGNYLFQHSGIANVKNIVRSLMNSGDNPFEVSNDNLGGDPAYGWYKKLTVTYVTGKGKCSHLCDVKIRIADEGDQINLN